MSDNRDIVDVIERAPRLSEAEVDRLRGESGVVLDAAEAFFLSGAGAAPAPAVARPDPPMK
jgi:hypothetical protein